LNVPGRTERAGYIIAVGAALAYGTNAVLTRRGLGKYGAPLNAIVIALVVGVLVLAPLAVRAWRMQGEGWRPERRATLFILFSGLSAILG
jgi:drug/metabolite transporter (DMT)-like permease